MEETPEQKLSQTQKDRESSSSNEEGLDFPHLEEQLGFEDSPVLQVSVGNVRESNPDERGDTIAVRYEELKVEHVDYSDEIVNNHRPLYSEQADYQNLFDAADTKSRVSCSVCY